MFVLCVLTFYQVSCCMLTVDKIPVIDVYGSEVLKEIICCNESSFASFASAPEAVHPDKHNPPTAEQEALLQKNW